MGGGGGGDDAGVADKGGSGEGGGGEGGGGEGGGGNDGDGGGGDGNRIPRVQRLHAARVASSEVRSVASTPASLASVEGYLCLVPL